MYGYTCEYCDGVVKEKLVKKEVFKHKTGFIMLENVPVGVCEKCGYRYCQWETASRKDRNYSGCSIRIKKEHIVWYKFNPLLIVQEKVLCQI